MCLRSGLCFCFEYACVREKVCRYSSVSEENEREGTESSFMRERRKKIEN